jgi:hypothetical protein
MQFPQMGNGPILLVGIVEMIIKICESLLLGNHLFRAGLVKLTPYFFQPLLRITNNKRKCVEASTRHVA